LYGDWNQYTKAATPVGAIRRDPQRGSQRDTHRNPAGPQARVMNPHDSEFEFRDGELTLCLTSLEPHRTHGVPTCHFAMVHAQSGELLGNINLRTASTFDLFLYSGHIGYEVSEKHRGRRYAARSVRLLFPLAKRLGLDPLWITCDPENLASRRTCEIAGGKLVEIVNVPDGHAMRRMGIHRKCRYRF
jgi:predicted acetyltransferase